MDTFIDESPELMLGLDGQELGDNIKLKENLDKCKKGIVTFVRKRATLKRKITLISKNLGAQKANSTLTSSFYEVQNAEVSKLLSDIANIDEKILQVYEEFNVHELGPQIYLKELDAQTEYNMNVAQNLCDFKVSDSVGGNNLNKNSMGTGSETLATGGNLEIRPPPLNCPNFSGESADKFEFKTFLMQFENVIGSKKNLSDSSKLVYLRGYLSKYAYKLIQHLSVCDSNYLVAMELLKKEFLDLNYITDELLKRVLYAKPNFDPKFLDTRTYLNEMRAVLFELQSLNLNFLEPDSAGCTLVSHIIFNKLPMIVKRELTHKTGSNYPSVIDIFEHYNDVLKMLNKTTFYKPKNTDFKPDFTNYAPNSTQNSHAKTASFARGSFKQNYQESTLQNFQATATKPKLRDATTSSQGKQSSVKTCKFCATSGHSLLKCPHFVSVQSRLARCRELKLCELCTSTKHDKSSCPGKDNKLPFNCQVCSSNNHIAALCDRNSVTSNNLCLNCSETSGNCSFYLLPTITISLSRGNSTVQVRCLVDCGAQRSYFARNVIENLKYKSDIMTPVNFEIRTFIGSENRSLNESMLMVGITPKCKVELPVLIDDNLLLNFKISGINCALTNLMDNGFELADTSFAHDVDHSIINLGGLIGTDILQFFPKFELIKCMNGSAFLTNEGIVPFGNVNHFMSLAQISETVKNTNHTSGNEYSNVSSVSEPNSIDLPDNSITRESSNNSIILNNNSSIVEDDTNESIALITNSVMEPSHCYFSPLNHILPDSDVEHGLENLFSLESIGISENEIMSNEDEIKIKEFNDGIEFANGRYYVELPWYRDKLSQVPSNSGVALAVLNRTVSSLNRKGLLLDYQNVFEQQLTDGIIEQIFVQPSDYDKFVWIPHRPVIKVEQQVTTKIRPVFNASLKVNNLPSLNESAYTGIDLMSSLPKLLLHFRSNPYVMLSDVKQAFLQIKLKLEDDKNKFAFFWLKEGELVCYRYNTLIFGFTTSPFILNYIIKYHASSYPDDECTKLLSNNFYVDNFIVTGKDLNYLKEIYNLSNSRMEEGGFVLRSWATNDNTELKNLMLEEGRLAEHGCNEERVLGYRYNTMNDTVSLANFELDINANTKRTILAQTSKIFDPLSLFLPVTIRGRLLMRSLWKLKVDWDEIVPPEMIKTWQSLYHEYNQLKEISAPRCAFNSSELNSLHIFCDASKKSYGFAAYAHNNCDTNLIFAKAKVAPIQDRTLPSLELLSVFLAVKCLDTLLVSYQDQFKFVNIFVDAQIVLSWLLSGNVKVKNIFIKNRVKDIMSMKSELEVKHKLKISFSYVQTSENPADLCTRGISTREFKSKFPYWMKGPTWISNNLSDVPKNDLSCLSDHSKTLTTGVNAAIAPIQNDTLPPILNIDKYSNFNKLLRVTSNVYKFFSKCRKTDVDCDLQAKLYWIKKMQSESFPTEIDFLKNKPHDKHIPNLVNQLDLFLDKEGVLRSKGRIQKALLYSYDVLNPIMIGKGHAFSNLIIMDSHNKCQHLGLQTTVNFLRNRGFWVPRARQAVKNVISSCYMCKKFNNLALQYPKMTNISKSRMKLIKPFDHTGVDHTGHFFVKDPNLGKCVKMYILIYTCMNIRAVHLDLVPDMSAESFLLSYQRFSNLYGIPSFLYSDNAKGFTTAGKILESSLTSSLFQDHLSANNT